MTPSQRILANTMASYASSLVGLALGLFSSRWVWHALGPLDYGLMAVVGSLIAFMTFLNAVLAGGTARFFAFSIGRADPRETNRWFNVALLLHLLVSVGLVVVGWPAGEWAMRAFLNIPEARMATAQWVFRISVISGFFSMFSVPFAGMFIAKQQFLELNLWSIVRTLVNCALAFSVSRISGDAWLLYSAGSAALNIAITLVQVVRARKLYPECRLDLNRMRDAARAREIMTFCGWGLIESTGGLLRGQGIAILLNKHFDPATHPQVNASFSVANTVSGYTQTLSTALLGAIAPEINRTEGEGNRAGMLVHAARASRFGTYLVLVFAVPMLLEVDYLLQLWLKNPPALAAPMCTLVLSAFIIERLNSGEAAAVVARGKVGAYAVTVGGIILLTLPIAWLFLHLGFDATAVCWAYVLANLMGSFAKIFWAHQLVGSSPERWLKGVLVPCCLVLLGAWLVGRAVQECFAHPSFARLCSVTAATLVTNTLLGWFVLLTQIERDRTAALLFRFKQRIGWAL